MKKRFLPRISVMQFLPYLLFQLAFTAYGCAAVADNSGENTMRKIRSNIEHINWSLPNWNHNKIKGSTTAYWGDFNLPETIVGKKTYLLRTQLNALTFSPTDFFAYCQEALVSAYQNPPGVERLSSPEGSALNTIAILISITYAHENNFLVHKSRKTMYKIEPESGLAYFRSKRIEIAHHLGQLARLLLCQEKVDLYIARYNQPSMLLEEAVEYRKYINQKATSAAKFAFAIIESLIQTHPPLDHEIIIDEENKDKVEMLYYLKQGKELLATKKGSIFYCN